MQESQRSFEQRAQTAHGPIRWRRITVNEFAERFLREHVAHLQPRSAGNYHRALERSILPALGDRMVSEVTAADVACLCDPRRSRPSVANYTRSVLSVFFAKAATWGVATQPNPVAYVARSKAAAFEQLSRDEREAFVGAAERITPAQAAFTIRCAMSLAPEVRDHLCELSLVASGATGALSTRRLLLAIAAAHEDGHRAPLTDTEVRLFTWFVAHSYLDRLPAPRSRGAAILWLSTRTPLITRNRGPRGSRYTVHLEWLGAPSASLMQACTNAPATSAAATPREAHERGGEPEAVVGAMVRNRGHIAAAGCDPMAHAAALIDGGSAIR